MLSKEKLKELNWLWTPNKLLLWSVFLGILTGWVNISYLNTLAQAISKITIDSLKLLSVPIIFVSILSTITGMSSIEEMKSLGVKVMKYTLITTLLAATVALAFFLIVDPVQQIHSTHIEGLADGESPSYLKAVLDMYPSNIVSAFAENNVIGVLLFAGFFGFSVLTLSKEHKENLHKLFSSLFAALVKMTQLLIMILPVGIWAFVAIFVKEFNSGKGLELENLMRYIFVVFGSTLFQGFVVLPLLLKFKGISPLKTFQGFFDALSLAFFSKSSSASLPVTLRCAKEKLNISPEVANFSLPLCTTCNMNGCAAFILNTVLFVSMSHGVVFSYFDLVMWIFIASIAAIGNAGVPMGCYFLSSAFLAAMNVPLDIMKLILPIYTLMDMVETSVNVWSDGCVTAIVEKEYSADLIQQAELKAT